MGNQGRPYGKTAEDWRDFNERFIPVYLAKNPDKKKVSAGLACGMLHTIAKGIRQGDIVLCPDGSGKYYVGEVTSDYYFEPGDDFCHRRKVHWFDRMIDKSEMSIEMQKSSKPIATVANLTKYAVEIEKLLAGTTSTLMTVADPSVEDPTVFALEKHLEDFLVTNWGATEFGKKYDIFEEEGELVGQQYPSDTGPIDILAISKDKKEILVLELKKGRASDVVVGQIQRYMGYVVEELAETGQTVRGVIIALEDDLRLRRAMKVTQNIDFYRYQVSFSLFKG